MTLPDERTRAVTYAREFLRDLLDPSKTKKIPREIRERAAAVLRHFPTDLDLREAAKISTKVFDYPKEDE